MSKNLLKKIIVGGLIVGGLASIEGCCDTGSEQKPANKEYGYFTDKGLIGTYSSFNNKDGVAMAVGDMDGDGDLDIVLAKSNGNNCGIRYFENLGDGKYADKGLIGTCSSFNSTDGIAIAVGDMDGDGDLDIVLAKSSSSNGGIRYFENNIPQKNK